jgi:hypothetical protein
LYNKKREDKTYMAFKRNSVVGVSINPEMGLEVAQVDYMSRTVLKYGCKPLEYDSNRKEVADLDIFKETLIDLLFELQIPKGSEIVLNIPTVLFRVADHPASLSEAQILSHIEDEISGYPLFQDTEADISTVRLPNSTLQFNKIAYAVAQKTALIEIAMQIQEIGYKLICIDTSVNSTLNALVYNDRVDSNPDSSWLLLMIENNTARVLSMQGSVYVDCYEERLSIGEVLGDEENYSTVINAISPILKNVPSNRLYIISKTNIINAEVLANKLAFTGQIIHHNANMYASAPYLEVLADIDDSVAKTISPDVIGAAIYKNFRPFATANINLFNESLGDVFLLEQPPVLKIGSMSIVLSLENMINASIIFVTLAIALTVILIIVLKAQTTPKQVKIEELNREISTINEFLVENKNISSELFDEGDEIRMGLVNNKAIYSYLTIVGTEIPKKLWLTSLQLGKYTTIEGQADNIESVYSFFRNIKEF